MEWRCIEGAVGNRARFFFFSSSGREADGQQPVQVLALQQEGTVVLARVLRHCGLVACSDSAFVSMFLLFASVVRTKQFNFS